MAGIDKRTGKLLEEPEHIKQSVETILTTPVGSRVMRRDMGFNCLDVDGRPKLGLTKDRAEVAAMSALATYEPRIDRIAVTASFSQESELSALDVRYTEIKSGKAGRVIISYPIRTG